MSWQELYCLFLHSDILLFHLLHDEVVLVEVGIIRWQDICEAIKLFQIMHSLSAVTRLFISIKRYPGIYVQAIRAMMCLLDKVGCFMMILFLMLSFVQTIICKKTKKSMQFQTSIFILNYIIRTTHQPLPTPCRGLVVDRTGDAILIYGPPANSNKVRDTNISGRLIPIITDIYFSA